MALPVRYSLRARHEEIELLEYVLKKFGQKSAKEVYDKIEKYLKALEACQQLILLPRSEKVLESAFLVSRPASIIGSMLTISKW